MEVTESWVFEQENLLIKEGLAFTYIDTLRFYTPFSSYQDFVKIDFKIKAQVIEKLREQYENKNIRII